ncbi:uncharacterized protein LOC115477560 [Microcaecilia unicolor]|uniref:Uncharacterized protein LOC115477560 n=1 Tax=Microcaecilia unicolor TaxID=1415580 RepID=A0A6P7Z3R5_9AMPH|nr:uncharacterized protein LOC115477560 [Microcaecilia unicolor]
MKDFEVKASVPALNPSPPALKSIRGFSYSGRQKMILFHGNRKNIKFSSYPAWQSCPRFQENVAKQLKKSALYQVVPCYMTFVRGARLWDRGIYHYTNDHANVMPPLTCARFIAHMKTPTTAQSPRLIATKPPMPVKQQNHSKDVPSTSKNIWNSSVFSRGRQKQILQPYLFKQHLYNEPQSPAPSVASMEEDVTKTSRTSVPSTTDTMAFSTHDSGIDEKKKVTKDPELVCVDPNVQDDPDLKKSDKLSDLNSSVLCAIGDSHSDLSQSSSNITGNQTSLLIDRRHVCSDFSRQESSVSVIGSGKSTPLSQLRSSSVSISALASSSFGSGSDISQNLDKTSQHKSSLLEASSSCSSSMYPSLNSSSYHGSGDLFQESSYSVKKRSGQAPSFVENWHDQHLHHWPVLPPISPQRDVIEILYDEASQASRFSNDAHAAFDELDGVMPCTGSSFSQYSQDGLSHKDFSSVSEISMRAVSLKLGCDYESESLTDVRLSLLDHQNWTIANQNPGTSQETEWDSTQTDKMESREETEAEFSNADIYDELYHASTSVKETTSSYICSETGMDDQKSICRMSTEKKSSTVFKDKCYNSTSTSVEPPSCNKLRRNSSDTEIYLVKDYYSSALLPASKSEIRSHKREDSCYVKTEKIGDSGRGETLNQITRLCKKQSISLRLKRGKLGPCIFTRNCRSPSFRLEIDLLNI